MKMDFSGVATAVRPIGIDLPILATVKYGGRSKKFREVIRLAGMKINDDAEMVLSHDDFCRDVEEKEADVVAVSIGDVGLERATLDIFCHKATGPEFGLELCPKLLAPYFRLYHKKQPKDELLIFGMKPVAAKFSEKMFFLEHCQTGLWLGADPFDPNYMWHGSQRFLLIRPRIQSF